MPLEELEMIDPGPPGLALPDCSRVSAPRRRMPSSSSSHCSAIPAHLPHSAAHLSPPARPPGARQTPPHASRPRPAPRAAALPGAVIARVTLLPTRLRTLDHGMEPALAGAPKRLKLRMGAMWRRIRAVGLGT